MSGLRSILRVLVHDVQVAAGGSGGGIMVAAPAVPYLMSRDQHLLQEDQGIGGRGVRAQSRVVDDLGPG